MGGGSKQTTTSNSEPWKGAQPAMNSALAGAQNLYNSGVGSQVYTGSTVVPWSYDTARAMGNIAGIASDNMDGAGLSGHYQYTINNGGYTNEMRDSMSGFKNIADSGGYNDATRNALGINQGIVNAGGFNSAQNAALRNTQNIANSQYSITPELQAVLDSTGAQVANNVNLGASAVGRYGGGLHQGAVAREVGDVTNRAVLSDYNNFLGRRDAANNNLFQMGQTGQGNVMAAGSNIGSLGQNALNARQGALSSIGNLGQQAFNNIGTAYSGLTAPARDMMSVGAMHEDLSTRLKNDELRIFNESQNLPWENVSRLNAIASGAGSLGGTTRGTQPGQNPFLSALGYGASGLGLLGSFF